jgi:hypothetical protein
MMPRFDLLPANPALCISALLLEIQLNNVVFPEPASPIIPHFSGIKAFLSAKVEIYLYPYS